MKIDERNGSTVFRRATEYLPGKGWSRLLIGRPLSTADAPHQTIGKFLGLAVFSSDAMSSVAYAPQEILIILAAAGVTAFHLSVPIALGICALLAILIFSYEQTIYAYPNGGGSFIVARDNIGAFPAQVAAAALLTDYILTVAVSISSGVAQLISAFPGVEPFKIPLAIFFVLLIMMVNLRGVKESGITFAIPTYFFLGMMYINVIVGFIRLIAGTLGSVESPLIPRCSLSRCF